jgi:hypothetical protein
MFTLVISIIEEVANYQLNTETYLLFLAGHFISKDLATAMTSLNESAGSKLLIYQYPLSELTQY